MNGLVIIYQFSYSVFGFERDFEIGVFKLLQDEVVINEVHISIF